MNTENSLFNVHFYMKSEVCTWLYKKYGGKEQEINVKFGYNDNYSYDVIDQPFHCEIKVANGDVALLLYIRNVYGIYQDDDANIHMVFHSNGESPTMIRQSVIGGNIGDIVIYYLKVAFQLRKQVSDSFYKSIADINLEKEGVLVSLLANDIVFERISGKKRPSMICNSLFEGMHMARPYQDELVQGLMSEGMSLEGEKIMPETAEERARRIAEEEINRREEDIRRQEAIRQQEEKKKQEAEKKKREEELRKRVKCKEQIIRAFSSIVCVKIKEENQVLLEEQKAVKKQAEENLAALGFFKRKQKKEQQAIIEGASGKIKELKAIIANAETISEIGMKKASELAKDEEEYLRKQVERLFPASNDNTGQESSSKKDPIQLDNEKAMDAIMETLTRNNKAMTEEEIVKQTPYIEAYTWGRINRILTIMKEEKKIRVSRDRNNWETIYAVLDRPDVDLDIPFYDVIDIDVNDTEAVKMAIKNDLEFKLLQWQYDSNHRLRGIMADMNEKDIIDTRQIRLDLLRFSKQRESQNSQPLNAEFADSFKDKNGNMKGVVYDCENEMKFGDNLIEKEGYLTDKGRMLLAECDLLISI